MRQTLDAPTRPGIYKFSLTPKAAGDARLVFDIQTKDATSQIVISGLKVYTDKHDAQHDAADAVASSSNGVVFTKEQSWNVNFSTEPVRNAPFGQVIKTMGKVAPTQADEHVVSATISGIVTLNSKELVAGATVNQGQALMTVQSNRMADDNLTVRISDAKVEYEVAKQEYERKKALIEDKLVTQSELAAAQARYETARARYNSLSSNFGNGTQSVSAPISGYVTRLLVANGQYVEAGQPLIGVSRNNQVLIEAQIQPKYYNLLSDIVSANFVMPSTGEAFDLASLDGRMLSFSKSVDAANPRVTVSFEVNNTIGLLPGTFVDTYILTRGSAPVLAVPSVSLIEEMGNYFVYVQLTPEFFEKREVSIGQNDGEYTQILSGLRGNERVVAKGAVLVKLAQASGKLDAHAGHVH